MLGTSGRRRAMGPHAAIVRPPCAPLSRHSRPIPANAANAMAPMPAVRSTRAPPAARHRQPRQHRQEGGQRRARFPRHQGSAANQQPDDEAPAWCGNGEPRGRAVRRDDGQLPGGTPARRSDGKSTDPGSERAAKSDAVGIPSGRNASGSCARVFMRSAASRANSCGQRLVLLAEAETHFRPACGGRDKAAPRHARDADVGHQMPRERGVIGNQPATSVMM